MHLGHVILRHVRDAISYSKDFTVLLQCTDTVTDLLTGDSVQRYRRVAPDLRVEPPPVWY